MFEFSGLEVFVLCIAAATVINSVAHLMHISQRAKDAHKK